MTMEIPPHRRHRISIHKSKLEIHNRNSVNFQRIKCPVCVQCVSVCVSVCQCVCKFNPATGSADSAPSQIPRTAPNISVCLAILGIDDVIHALTPPLPFLHPVSVKEEECSS